MNTPPTAAEWQARIEAARKRGNHFGAYDLAVQALSAWPDVVRFDHEAILALARAGALRHARKRYDALIAENRLALVAEQDLGEDLAALDGRLWKDLARRSAPEEADRYRRLSAEAYETAFHRFNRPYAGINAASMFLATGQAEAARHYAQQALERARHDPPDDYYRAATEAEALIILGDPAGATEALRRASALGAHDLDRLATTRAQLGWVAPLAGTPDGTLDALVRPRVLTWSVDPAASDFDVAAQFPAGESLVVIGPILSAGDVFLAQALLSIGADLSLVLPCDPDLLLPALSQGRDSGPPLDAVLMGARQILRVTDEGGPHEPAARLLCQQQAEGLTRLRAAHLAVAPELLRPALLPPAGTVALGPLPDVAERGVAELGAESAASRAPHAILFGDVRSFSTLTEAEQLLFLTHVVGGFGAVLDGFVSVEYAETAGDGLFVVMTEIGAAVECAFALHQVLAMDRLRAAGLPERLGLRLSMHIGPLYRRFDGVIKRDKFCGMEVIRTARIGPVTPVGEIFVTEQFAAVLAVVRGTDYVCEYAGIQPMAKNFGTCRMYSLRRMTG